MKPLFLILAFLCTAQVSAATKSICGSIYKGIMISCDLTSVEETESEKKFVERCRKYIDKIKITPHDEIYCHLKNPTWCIRIPVSYRCYQKDDGDIFIVGQLNREIPHGFSFRKTAKD